MSWQACLESAHHHAKCEHSQAIANYMAVPLASLDAAHVAKGEHDLNIDNYRANWHVKRGIACALRGVHDQAIACYTAAIQSRPDCAIPYYNRGLAYDAKGEHDQAIADFTAAIRIQPDFAFAYYNRGVALSKKGALTRPSPTTRNLSGSRPSLPPQSTMVASPTNEKGDEPDLVIFYYTKAIQIQAVPVPVRTTAVASPTMRRARTT